MPVELPGFYFDENRNRYFPKSTLPKPLNPPETSANIDSKSNVDTAGVREGRRLKQSHTPWRFQQTRLISSSYTQIMRESHQNTGFHYALSSLWKHEKVPTFGDIRAIYCTKAGDRVWRLVGDNLGWLYSDKELMTSENDNMHYWSADWCLRPSTPITSISVSESRFLSTCLGPGKFSVQDLHCPERIFLLNLHGVKDIRASHIQGKEVILGAKEKVIYIEDIDNSTSPRHIHTKSDVFTVLQKSHSVYAGERNGTIERFDIRTPSHQSQKLFDHRFVLRPRSTVLKLDVVQEHGLFLSHLDGDLALYDLRFSSASKAEPITVFEGHVNSYLGNLGMAIDPDQDFLFAAGQDCRLRGWSLRTGRSLYSEHLPDDQANPFTGLFPSPISALQVTRDEGSNHISLWAAYGHDLCCFHLGQRSHPLC